MVSVVSSSYFEIGTGMARIDDGANIDGMVDDLQQDKLTISNIIL